MSKLDIFDEFQTRTQQEGVQPALDWLAEHFRDQHQYASLFEARKMQVRQRLGLGLLYGQQPDPLDEPTQRMLEEGLLDACREVGELLFREGDFRQGWLYLQPVGDRALSEELVRAIPVTEENADGLVDVCFHQGACPEYGFQLLLDTFGTCNAITTFESQAGRFEKPVQQAMAGALVDHLYRELVGNVRRHIADQKGTAPGEEVRLDDLLQQHSWLTEGANHHVDTTHLASIMRIGRIVDDPERLDQLCQLARYGQRLHSDFHYRGDPPFEQTYDDHLRFYRALQERSGPAVDEAIRELTRQARELDRARHGAVAVETLVDLLCRLGLRQPAIDIHCRELYGRDDLLGIAPNLFEVPQSRAELENLTRFFRDQEDLLGFAVGTLQQQLADHGDAG